MYSSILLNISSGSSDSDEDEQFNVSAFNRQIRNSINLLQVPDHTFVAMFRINKNIFQMLQAEMEPFFTTGKKNTCIPAQLRLGTFLIFLATGSYQASIGREYVSSMNKATVCIIIAECLDIFENKLCRKWINLKKSDAEENECKQKFYVDGGIPGIVGCVAGTHVRIKNPGEKTDRRTGIERANHLYYNRKGYYSLNVMAICDHRMVITYVDARHPGANHDSFVWEHSKANQYFSENFNRGKRNTWLLGDGGYKLEPYMMTPYRNPKSQQETLFNTTQREKTC